MTHDMKIIPIENMFQKNYKIIGSATVCKITDVKKHDEPKIAPTNENFKIKHDPIKIKNKYIKLLI